MGSVFDFYQVTHHESVLAIMTEFGHVSSYRKDWKSGFGPRMLFLCQRQWGGNPREMGQSACRLYQLLRYFLERNWIDGISTKSTLFIVVRVHLRLLQINRNSKAVLSWELLEVNKNSKIVLTWALLQINKNCKVVLTLELLQINKNSKVVLTWELLQINRNSRIVLTRELLQINRNSKVVLTRRDQPSISHELVRVVMNW